MSNPAETKTETPPPAKSGGIGAWLPLIITVLLMPALAFVMTNFVLIPKLTKALGSESVSARESGESSGKDSHGSKGGHGDSKHDKESGSIGKSKIRIPLSKLVVNVSGSLGSRLLLASITLAGNNVDLKTKVEENMDQLRDLASSILSTKTITDLEKPEARNLLRAELISQFNSVLGGGVEDIYITELAIQ